ncbi:MAG: hypothetical protein QOH64_473, partial [Acidimicrobiaceae bacterium]
AVVLIAASAFGLLVFAAAPAHADAIRPIRFPVDGPVRFTDTYGAPRAGGTVHEGQDLMGTKLERLVAARDGVISYVKTAGAGEVTNGGNMLVVRDSEGWEYWYIHINNDTPGTDDGANPAEYNLRPGVKVGTKVFAGEWIAYMGDSGDAENTAPHLHFELHRPDGVAIDPYDSLQAASRGGIDPTLLAANAPKGALDVVTGAGGVIVARGWAFDPNVAGASTAQFFVDGRFAGSLAAGEPRADVGAFYPAAGPKHGYTAYLTPPAGTHRVCAYAINDGAGGSPGLGCATVESVSRPIGSLDVVKPITGGLLVGGWALDRDTAAPIDVHVYIDGALAAITPAGLDRPDVGAAFPGFGNRHGFATPIAASPGSHTVCAYAIDDTRVLSNPLLGCRTT